MHEVDIVIALVAQGGGSLEINVYTSVIGMVVMTTVLSPLLIKYVYTAGKGD